VLSGVWHLRQLEEPVPQFHVYWLRNIKF